MVRSLRTLCLCGETIPIMSETTRLTAWRLGIIFGVLAIVETSVRVGWISTFFLAAPTRAAVVLWEQIVHGNALWLTGNHAL